MKVNINMTLIVNDEALSAIAHYYGEEREKADRETAKAFFREHGESGMMILSDGCQPKTASGFWWTYSPSLRKSG